MRLQLTALEIRTTHATLTWRLWVASPDDPQPLPDIEVTDDLGTSYRTEVSTSGWSSDADIVRGDGEFLIVPAIPPGARALMLRIDRAALDPEEARDPGATPMTMDRPTEVAVDLTAIVHAEA